MTDFWRRDERTAELGTPTGIQKGIRPMNGETPASAGESASISKKSMLRSVANPHGAIPVTRSQRRSGVAETPNYSDASDLHHGACSYIRPGYRTTRIRSRHTKIAAPDLETSTESDVNGSERAQPRVRDINHYVQRNGDLAEPEPHQARSNLMPIQGRDLLQRSDIHIKGVREGNLLRRISLCFCT
jgi:hypothetical protein